MREILELQEAIERQRSRVNAMIENGTDDEALIRENLELDRLIEIYYIVREASGEELSLYQED